MSIGANAPWMCGVRLFRGQCGLSHVHMFISFPTLASLVRSSNNPESQSRPPAVVVVVVIQLL